MDAVPLNVHIYTTVAPDQVRHTLTDDGWSSYDLGPLRIQIPTGDLTRVRAAKTLAETLAAQGAMWARDLAAIEDALTAAEQAKVAEHATGPQPAVDPDAPFGGDDPDLDKQVEKVATLPETRRKRTPKDAT